MEMDLSVGMALYNFSRATPFNHPPLCTQSHPKPTPFLLEISEIL
jgi:hypothetical protein